MPRLVRDKERNVSFGLSLPYSLVKQLDDLMEAAGLRQGELIQLLLVRGLESFRNDPQLNELARRTQIYEASRATKG